MLSILIVDDEFSNREILSEIIKKLGHFVETAEDGKIALQKTMNHKYDLILSDIRMPNYDGIEFFNTFQNLNSNSNTTQFAFMTAYGKIDEAIELMKKGALHFLTKPLRKKDIVKIIDEVKQRQNTPKVTIQNKTLPLGISKEFKNVLDTVHKIANSNANILLVGESGTGKEVIARYIHSLSNRSNQKFSTIHSAAIPENLLESELFGYEKGAFTGSTHSNLGILRSANNGTVFIDELSSMSLLNQTKLLRVIQNKEIIPIGSNKISTVDLRWISATNVHLQTLVDKGLFREDLLFRLNVIQIDLPTLKERKDDILYLADIFLHELCSKEGKKIIIIKNETKQFLENYSWPGNIRELRNVIERAVILSKSSEFTSDLLPDHFLAESVSNEIKIKVGATLQSIEDKVIEKTLISCNWDKNAAAIILGVAPRTIYRWIEKQENSL